MHNRDNKCRRGSRVQFPLLEGHAWPLSAAAGQSRHGKTFLRNNRTAKLTSYIDSILRKSFDISDTKVHYTDFKAANKDNEDTAPIANIPLLSSDTILFAKRKIRFSL